MKRRLAAMFYRRRLMCFACGKLTDTPCPGHGWGGLIGADQVRPWCRRAPAFWLLQFVDSRWLTPPRKKRPA